jgi:hypothetical protein
MSVLSEAADRYLAEAEDQGPDLTLGKTHKVVKTDNGFELEGSGDVIAGDVKYLGGRLYDRIMTDRNLKKGDVIEVHDGNDVYRVVAWAWPVQISGPKKLDQMHTARSWEGAQRMLGPRLLRLADKKFIDRYAE